MDMEDLHANVLRGDEEVVHGVAVTFQHGGAFVQDDSWSGTFDLPPGAFIAHGGPYVLALGDGRRALILVQATRVEEGGILVQFAGVGPFPHRDVGEPGA
jgi:hypothetical protein